VSQSQSKIGANLSQAPFSPSLLAKKIPSFDRWSLGNGFCSRMFLRGILI
jgi:hypothetical protein